MSINFVAGINNALVFSVQDDGKSLKWFPQNVDGLLRDAKLPSSLRGVSRNNTNLPIITGTSKRIELSSN